MEFSTTQQAIINAIEPHIVVMSGGGAGKTATITERIRRLINDGADPRKMVAITFTNNAANEMRDRLGECADKMFIGTVHSYANRLLMRIDVDTHDYLKQEDFDHLFLLAQQNPRCFLDVDYLFVDEAQDSTRQQFDFFGMINAKNWMYVGDVRQSIYQYDGAVPQLLIDLSERDDVTTYIMKENYRNAQSILKFAKGISRIAGLSKQDESVAMRDEQGQVLSVVFDPDCIAQTIKRRGRFVDWFILCRENQQVQLMCDVLRKYRVPYDTFSKKDLSPEELNRRMSANDVKVLTVHASKGLERKNVIVIGTHFTDVEEKCIAYVAATRARDLLVWTSAPKKPKNHATPRGVTMWDNNLTSKQK